MYFLFASYMYIFRLCAKVEISSFGLYPHPLSKILILGRSATKCRFYGLFNCRYNCEYLSYINTSISGQFKYTILLFELILA